jgi:hypothetical protein
MGTPVSYLSLFLISLAIYLVWMDVGLYLGIELSENAIPICFVFLCLNFTVSINYYLSFFPPFSNVSVDY